MDIPTWNRCKIPPCICRLLARVDDRLMTDPELMAKTGWGKARLRAIYHRHSWDGVTHEETDLFLWACNIEPSKQRRYLWLLKRALSKGMKGLLGMRHLKCNTGWQGNQLRLHLNRTEKLLRQHGREQSVRTAEVGE